MSTPNRYDLVGKLEMVEVEGGPIFCIVLDKPLDQFMCQHYAISFPTAENRLSMLGVVPASWEGKRVKITVEEEAEKVDLDVKIIKLEAKSRLMNGDFGDALYVLKRGGKVTRRGWNGKDMYIFLEDWSSTTVAPETEPLFFSRGCIVRPTICMKDAQNKLVVGWLASQTDLLAEDYVEVE